MTDMYYFYVKEAQHHLSTCYNADTDQQENILPLVDDFSSGCYISIDSYSSTMWIIPSVYPILSQIVWQKSGTKCNKLIHPRTDTDSTSDCCQML